MRRFLKHANTRHRIPLRVHCWGGFGSQLLGCTVANRLAIRYPKRRIILIFHSSGVTPRFREIPKTLTTKVLVQEIDDFNSESNYRAGQPRQHTQLSIYSNLIRLMKQFGILARLNTEEDFNTLKPWLFEARGHYTGISLTKKEVHELFSKLQLHIEGNQTRTSHSAVSLHFRLGDLRHLSMKSHISVSRLSGVINSNFESNSIKVFSDSLEDDVRRLIVDAFLNKNLAILNLPTLQVLRECINCSHFVGTNSKISLWIVIFRTTLSIGVSTYVPIEMMKQLQDLLPNQDNLERINFY